MTDVITAVVALVALGVTAWNVWRTHNLAVGHAGAQAAIAWRDQVLELHDRGLEPEQIRWIMCCEDGGHGYEASNGIIDEIVRNVPRRLPLDLEQIRVDASRALPRPDGSMRSFDSRPVLPAVERHEASRNDQ